ncbi:MAG: M28 family peptidase [Candidatus Zixiibacteriota bacterium]
MKSVKEKSGIILFGLLALLLSVGMSGTTNLLSANPTATGNLYKIYIQSPQEAAALSALGVDAVIKVAEGYLVLASVEDERLFEENSLRFELIIAGVSRDELAIDIRHDNSNEGKYSLVYEEDGLRLFRADARELSAYGETPGLAPLPAQSLPVIYKVAVDKGAAAPEIEYDLDSLINLIEYDSLQSYLERLQAFYRRVAGTDSIYAARDWIAGKFADFGYDSIYLDHFVENLGGSYKDCYNVVAVKPGTLYPDVQIVVGAHYDAGTVSPGADDNGSGTVAVMDIARVIMNIETEMTYVFVLFDAEEWGLYGSYHYAGTAYANGDNILFMMNMDMIAHYQNDADAYSSYGSGGSTYYAQLWMALAASLPGINITGHMSVGGGGSDHYPFAQYGYDIGYAHEYIFSTVYHSVHDSTTYCNFDYMTRMVKTTFATVLAAAAENAPGPRLILSHPSGAPDLFFPNQAAVIQVQVDGYGGGALVPGTVALHYSVNGGTFETANMTDIGGGMFETTIPASPCYTRLEYYISADESQGGVYYDTDPLRPYLAAFATGMTSVFADDFETITGWTVTGDADVGRWIRRLPYMTMEGGPSKDYDNSGYCYVTDNPIYSDVDEGTTILTSPVLNLSTGDGVIEYARWYSNSTGSAAYSDIFTVRISDDNGASWTTVEQVGPVTEASGGWYIHRFWTGDFIDPSATVRLQFNASDLASNSVIEAGVDAVRVYSYNCGLPLQITTAAVPDWTFDVPISQTLAASGGYGAYTWADKNNDLSGTGLALSTDGHLTGTPSMIGEITFTAVVSDEVEQAAEKPFTFMINSYPEIMTQTIPNALINAAYSFQLLSSGGTGAVTWTDKNNDLSGSGFTLSSTGLLSGQSPDSMTIDFTAVITDAVGADTEKPLTFKITLPYICGDADHSGAINILDVTYVISYLYKGGPEPIPLISGDADNSGTINILDVTFLISYLYKGGPVPDC